MGDFKNSKEKKIVKKLQIVGNSEVPDTTTVTALTSDYLGNLLSATASALPNGEEGYAVGCKLIVGTNVYLNVGTVSIAVWSLATGMKAIQQTVLFSEFTDGLGTSGTLELAQDIPIGAYVLQASIDDVTGFTGDTSAVITIGDGSTADRYNTGTPNVFVTADTIDAGDVSGTAYHAAAKTPTLTVTSAADFTAVVAGQVTITIFYLSK